MPCRVVEGLRDFTDERTILDVIVIVGDKNTITAAIGDSISDRESGYMRIGRDGLTGIRIGTRRVCKVSGC